MKEGKYIKFLMDGTSKTGKTQKWRVVTKDDNEDLLGYISWYGPWRCYAFSAFCGQMFHTTPVFEKRCLRDIADFIEEQTKDHKLLTTPIHAHTAQFGSELWCSKCNTICYDKHGPSKLTWCGTPKCPMNPNKSPVIGNKSNDGENKQ
jgi:hypothetical protein